MRAYAVETLRNKTTPIAKAYGVKRMSLFGSYTKGKAKRQSNVDILIDCGEIKDLIQSFSFVNDWEDNLGCHVDVVTDSL